MAVVDSLLSGLRTLMNALPQILGGLIILVVLWVVGGILGRIIARVADRFGLDRLTDRAGINDFLERAGWHEASAGRILGAIAKWWIRILAVLAAVNAFGIPQLSQAVQAIFNYLPNLFAAIVILLVGAFLAKIAADLVTGFAAGSRMPSPSGLGTVTRVIVLFLTFIAVLQQLQIAAGVAQDVLVAALALVVGAGVLGVGLSFGLGGREAARRIIEETYERRRALGPSSSEQRQAPPGTRPTPGA